MPPEVRDPIDDLAKEIAAEAAASEQEDAPEEQEETPEEEKDAPAEQEEKNGEEETSEGEKDASEDKGDGEEETSEEEKDASEEEEEPPAKKSKERLIPVSERNREAAARRKAERELAAAQAELAELKGKTTGEDGKPAPKTEDQIREEARAEARMEMMVQSFLTAGYEEHGKKEFDGLCNTLSEMGAPQNLVPIAVAATGSPESAAKAIFQLSQQDPAEIEEILNMPPLRQGAALARLVTARPRRSAQQQEEVPVRKVSKAAPPIKPLKGANKVPEGLGDEVPDDVWTERFFKELEKPRSPYSSH